VYVTTLAGLSTLHVGPLAAKPPQAAAEIVGNLEIYVPLAGLVDLSEERQRIAKEIVKAESEIASMKKRLDNPDFVARAPADVVAKDRARVDELKARVTKLNENNRRIAPLEVRIAPPAHGAVDLSHELKDELAQVEVPKPDEQVREALDKLREGTKEGLTARDRQDLGVAYLNMGLVDDAVREFNKAKAGEETVDLTPKAAKAKPKPKAKAKAKPAPKKKKPAPKKAKAKARPAPKKKKKR
jgi:valyl-tRNA synthetase